MSIFTKLFGDPNEKVVKELRLRVEQINALEEQMVALSDADLQAKTVSLKQQLAEGKTLDDIAHEAFAVVREAAKRSIGQRHYDVQLMAGLVLHNGDIAEMKTGEGKTLSSTAAIYLNALTGKGVHVVTVNDYLAKRDCEWMGQIFHFLGLSVACLQHMSALQYVGEQEPSSEAPVATLTVEESDAKVDVDMSQLKATSRKDAYLADILYGTNSEFGFDYLRDNMAHRHEDMVQRELHFAIIDEVDSILIDEARTPLIISAPAEEAADKYMQFAQIVRRLRENEHFNIDEKMRAITLTDQGVEAVEKILNVENLYVVGGIAMVHHLEQALKAEYIFKRDKDYVVKEGEIMIVDEFTGRMMPGRRYSEGLHQALEAKEGVQIQQESQTLATITIQNYFRMYEKLAGMTGTAATEAEEFSKIYDLDVTILPTNKPIARQDLPDRIYRDEAAKYAAIVKEVKERNEKGQPILIGTIAIEKNEYLGELLHKEGIPVQILNAKQHEKEAHIIAQAGKKGAVTVATNMAGRGVDIILGGHPYDEKAAEEVRACGGLLVLGTERHESRRIDNQLRGRSGRQGDPGASQFFVSLDDDLMRIFGPMQKIKGLMTSMNVPTDVPIENSFISRALESAQKKVEQHNFDIRKHVLEYDDVLNKQRGIIYNRRKELLAAADENAGGVRDRIKQMIHDEIHEVVAFHTREETEGKWNLKEISEVMATIVPMNHATHVQEKLQELSEGNLQQADTVRTAMESYLGELADTEYEKMITGVKEKLGNEDAFVQMERTLLLRSNDHLWIDHLEAINHLRAGIGLRGYGQQDPLVEYKKESFRLFNRLLSEIRKQVVYAVYKLPLGMQLAPSILERQNLQFQSPEKNSAQKSDMFSALSKALDGQVEGRKHAVQNTDEVGRLKSEETAGRNDPCPCGSGKKFKKCHGKN